MNPSTGELIRAREIVGGILEELELNAYLFEVQPHDGCWEVRMECAVAEGWASRRLTVGTETLLRAAADPAVRGPLLQEWGRALAACTKSS